MGKVTEFGNNGRISVFVDEQGRFGTKKPEVTVNWSAIGSVSVERAQEFRNAMTEALIFAASEEQRLGLKS